MDDSALLAEWAARVGMVPLSDPTAVHAWGDMENGFAVRPAGRGYEVAYANRGAWTAQGRFDSVEEADAFLLGCLGAIWRADQGLADVFPAPPAPGSTIDQVTDGYEVHANGRRAHLRKRSDAKRYTYLAGMTLHHVADFLSS